LALDPAQRRNYWYFTDYFLLSKLAKVFLHLENDRRWVGQPNQKIPSDRAEWGVVADVHKFLRTFLFREKIWLTPFWKRPDEYERFAESVLGKGPERSRAFNDKLADMFETVIEREAKSLKINISNGKKKRDFKGEYSDYLVGKFNRELEEIVNEALKSDQCRVRAYYMARFAPFPNDLKLQSDGGWRDVKTLSPSVAGLETAWRAVPHLWLFREFYAHGENGEKIDPPIRDRQHLSNVRDKAAKRLKAAIRKRPKRIK
jgi:hypothetical protein